MAILWTDEKREWEAVLPLIKAARDCTTSALDPRQPHRPRHVWLRTVADRQDGNVGAGETAILYLPGVGNGQLRTDLRPERRPATGTAC
ncbi:hypothetical protein [Acidovorax sp.]|uniref:hypothetical protein n=1 Tax=Acidovorax sp. TaxID=1872122 RepID=UPI002ACEE799|nr:hypothetical protein [Acidovorax sp.]MDZ7862350.1 hypothetical protein [Acidovorax sp.]